jgi:hypothetical protein
MALARIGADFTLSNAIIDLVQVQILDIGCEDAVKELDQ